MNPVTLVCNIIITMAIYSIVTSPDVAVRSRVEEFPVAYRATSQREDKELGLGANHSERCWLISTPLVF